MGIGQKLKALWRDERGQSTTEYILILSVVVMIAMRFKSAFQGKLKTIVDNLGNQIEEAARDTGSN
jgi:Flp pilus assembly pilin Flp